jgi:hypothetical protein
MRRLSAAVLSAAMAWVLVPSAAAQDPTQVQGPTAAGAQPKASPDDPIQASFSLGGSYTFDADLDNDLGSISIWRAGSELGLRFPAAGKITFNAGIASEFSWYTFDPDLGGFLDDLGDATAEVALARLSLGATIELSDDWSLLVSGNGVAAGEYDADFGDSLTGGGAIAAIYRASDTLSFTFGVAGESVIEDDANIIPLLGFDWRFAEQWRVGVRGPGAFLTYSPTKQWDFTLQGSYERRDYRLSDDNPISDGVFRDKRFVVGVQAQWTPAQWLSLRAEAGVVAWAELEFDDRNGDHLDKTELDPTGYAGVSATIRF